LRVYASVLLAGLPVVARRVLHMAYRALIRGELRGGRRIITGTGRFGVER
jgi:hypothetical protein